MAAVYIVGQILGGIIGFGFLKVFIKSYFF